jgi:hypothetical protein
MFRAFRPVDLRPMCIPNFDGSREVIMRITLAIVIVLRIEFAIA